LVSSRDWMERAAGIWFCATMELIGNSELLVFGL
jgi:hypothetical protein